MVNKTNNRGQAKQYNLTQIDKRNKYVTLYQVL